MVNTRLRFLALVYAILLTTVILLLFLTSTYLQRWVTLYQPSVISCRLVNVPRAAYTTALFINKFGRAPLDYKKLALYYHSAADPLPKTDIAGQTISYKTSDIYPFLGEVERGGEHLVPG